MNTYSKLDGCSLFVCRIDRKCKPHVSIELIILALSCVIDIFCLPDYRIVICEQWYFYLTRVFAVQRSLQNKRYFDLILV